MKRTRELTSMHYWRSVGRSGSLDLHCRCQACGGPLVGQADVELQGRDLAAGLPRHTSGAFSARWPLKAAALLVILLATEKVALSVAGGHWEFWLNVANLVLGVFTLLALLVVCSAVGWELLRRGHTKGALRADGTFAGMPARRPKPSATPNGSEPAKP